MSSTLDTLLAGAGIDRGSTLGCHLAAIYLADGAEATATELRALTAAADPEADASTIAAADAIVAATGDASALVAAMAPAEYARRIAELEAELAGAAADVPWQDTRPLTSPPVPWSADDWQRDRRRAEADGATLSEDTWRTYAEQGLDAVHELRRERIEPELADMRRQAAAIANAANIAREDAARRKRDGIPDGVHEGTWRNFGAGAVEPDETWKRFTGHR